MAEKINTRYWVIIPAYNESKYIGRVLKKIKSYTNNIVIIDDGSVDDTANIAARYTEHVLVHSLNLGKGAALKTGCEYAFDQKGAQAIIMLDGDDQHDPTELQVFNNELNKGEKLLLGTRSLWEMPFFRSWGSRSMSALVAVLFGAYVPDILSGYKAFTKDVYKKIIWQNRGYGVEMEIAARIAQHKVPLKSIPIRTIYHDFERGMTVLDTIEALFQIVMLRFNL